MSKLEERIYKELKDRNINFEIQKIIPLDNCPWKKGRNIKSISDIYLPKSKTYIEIKGFMTIFAMSKMSWFCKQNINYYIFQGTEYDWPIHLNDMFLNNYSQNRPNTKTGILNHNIEYQIKELIEIEKNCNFDNNLSLTRLQGFIKNRINEYVEYNKVWY
ncbi:MAG: hypothetical protein NTY80_04105 [candidate division SR1 bacterium]|nr:hypothetical protein [candidate division SR1 bacterium]